MGRKRKPEQPVGDASAPPIVEKAPAESAAAPPKKKSKDDNSTPIHVPDHHIDCRSGPNGWNNPDILLQRLIEKHGPEPRRDIPPEL